jgi:hypothetical protein
MEKGSVVIVKKFIDAGATKTVGMGEMTEFWKACSDAEKLQFSNEAVALMPELAPAK